MINLVFLVGVLVLGYLVNKSWGDCGSDHDRTLDKKGTNQILVTEPKTGGTEGVRVTVQQDENHPLIHVIFMYEPKTGKMNVKLTPSYLVTKLEIDRTDQ